MTSWKGVKEERTAGRGSGEQVWKRQGGQRKVEGLTAGAPGDVEKNIPRLSEAALSARSAGMSREEKRRAGWSQTSPKSLTVTWAWSAVRPAWRKGRRGEGGTVTERAEALGGEGGAGLQGAGRVRRGTGQGPSTFSRPPGVSPCTGRNSGETDDAAWSGA